MKTILIIVLLVLLVGGGITVFVVEQKPSSKNPPAKDTDKKPAAPASKPTVPVETTNLIDQLYNNDEPVSPFTGQYTGEAGLLDTIALLNDDI